MGVALWQDYDYPVTIFVATTQNCRRLSHSEMSPDALKKARARDKRNLIVQAQARVLAAASHGIF